MNRSSSGSEPSSFSGVILQLNNNNESQNAKASVQSYSSQFENTTIEENITKQEEFQKEKINEKTLERPKQQYNNNSKKSENDYNYNDDTILNRESQGEAETGDKISSTLLL